MIHVQSTSPREALEGEVDEELNKFDEWFQSLGNSPIIKSERAIVKAFLAWKLGVRDGAA